MYQKKDNKRYKESLKSSEVSRTYLALISEEESASSKLQTTKVIQSHREEGLQMSSVNSTVNYVQATKLKKNKIP